MIQEDEQPKKKPPQLPKKLADRISNAVYDEEADIIVGNGDIELRSSQPVTVVEYFISVNRDNWSDATFKDYSYDLTRFLEYCSYAGINDLRSLSSRDIEGFTDWRKIDV